MANATKKIRKKGIALGQLPGQRWTRNIPLYIMLLPGLLYLIVYHYGPMAGLVVAFKDYRLTRGIFNSDWVGLQNFTKLFGMSTFYMALRNTIIISFYKLLVGFPAPIILALMLNEVRKTSTKRIFQTAYYLPHFISWVVVGNIFLMFLGPESGVLSKFLLPYLGEPLDIVMNPKVFRGLLVVSDLWKESGWSSIIYIAAFAGIDTELYDAARVDGANKWKQMWYVTLPSIMPTIVTMLLLRVGKILNAGFEQNYVMQNSMVYNVSEILDTYVYRISFLQSQPAIGAAAGLFKSVIGLIFVVTTNQIAKRFDQEVL